MKFECEVNVDFNGIVMFDFPGIQMIFPGGIAEGGNILESFTSTDKGDEVLDAGLAWPIMGVDDGGYRIRIFCNEKPVEVERKIIFEDKFFT
ncbi:hypothetical protein D3C77_238370 [compost metagenome]